MRFLCCALFVAFVPVPSAARQDDRPTPHEETPLAGSMPAAEPASARSTGGPLFISPMGEPFHGPHPQDIWFRQADADHDGRVSRAEFLGDAQRFFVALDRQHDGEIDPDDIDFYETVLAPEIRVGGGDGAGGFHRGSGGGGRGGRGGGRGRDGFGGGGGQHGDHGNGASTPGAAQRYDDQRRGAARFGWFDYPEPITVADTNMNRGIDPTEFRTAAEQRFATLDTNGDGFLDRGELPPLPDRGNFGRGKGRPGGHHDRGTPPLTRDDGQDD